MAELSKNGSGWFPFLTEVLTLISDICKQRGPGPHGLYGYKLDFRREFTKNPDYSIIYLDGEKNFPLENPAIL